MSWRPTAITIINASARVGCMCILCATRAHYAFFARRESREMVAASCDGSHVAGCVIRCGCWDRLDMGGFGGRKNIRGVVNCFCFQVYR